MDPTELLRLVTRALERLGIEHFVTGSTATITYGEPRFTNDLDIVVRLAPDQVEALCAEFRPEEYYWSPEAIARAVRNRSSFNVIHPSSGLKIDFIVADDSPFNRSRFSRVRDVPVGEGVVARFTSPEDIIVRKLGFYREGGSERHLRDIAGMLRVMGPEVDRAYVDHWAEELGLTAEWNEALRQANGDEDTSPGPIEP